MIDRQTPGPDQLLLECAGDNSLVDRPFGVSVKRTICWWCWWWFWMSTPVHALERYYPLCGRRTFKHGCRRISLLYIGKQSATQQRTAARSARAARARSVDTRASGRFVRCRGFVGNRHTRHTSHTYTLTHIQAHTASPPPNRPLVAWCVRVHVSCASVGGRVLVCRVCVCVWWLPAMGARVRVYVCLYVVVAVCRGDSAKQLALDDFAYARTTWYEYRYLGS